MSEIKLPTYMWHTGTCDMCKKKNIFVLHLGYDTQPVRDYRICGDCLFVVGIGKYRNETI